MFNQIVTCSRYTFIDIVERILKNTNFLVCLEKGSVKVNVECMLLAMKMTALHFSREGSVILHFYSALSK